MCVPGSRLMVKREKELETHQKSMDYNPRKFAANMIVRFESDKKNWNKKIQSDEMVGYHKAGQTRSKVLSFIVPQSLIKTFGSFSH